MRAANRIKTARAIYYREQERHYAECEARIDALGLREDFNQFMRTFKCKYPNKKYYYFFKAMEKKLGHKLVKLYQIARVLDKAHYANYCADHFKSERAVWLWLAANEDFTINEVDGMHVAWYEDLTNDKPTHDGVMYDIDKDKFVDYKFYDDGTVETFGYIK